ncbi:serine hydrolase domain-containing protein [Micromonospora sp. NPDC047465]|uniref:serine hydrolase domain-containing protein n=1 Tax=Micromonospora sp. NPDC047465 TaxID=3154813 RepID=UPI0033D978A1
MRADSFCWWRGIVLAAATGLAVSAGSGPAQAADAGDDAVDAGAVERVVEDFASRAGYPGIAVAITRGDQVLHVGGHGHDASGAAVTATTPMPVASVSKSFTALAVMQLVEAGKVELDAPVRRYLPDFQIDDARGARVTVRELLNQTSGITDRTLREKSLRQPDSLAAAQQRARAATLAADPGTRYAYTNTNYHLAARLVEVVSGEPFADYLRDRVFEPVGMRSTISIDQTPGDLPEQVREGYVYAFGATVPATEPKRFVAGSDGVIATAADMAQWLIMQNSGGVAASGARVVSASSITAMHTPSGSGSTYGLGWDRDDNGWVRHNGVWFTFTASQLLLPSGYGIAVLGNSGIGLGNEGTDQLADAIAELVAGGSPQAPAALRLIIDLVLAGFTLLSLALGVRNLRRSGEWARRFAVRPFWQPVMRLVPRLVPLALLVMLPDLLGQVVGGGRDVTFVQLAYYTLPLVVWTAVTAITNASVMMTRVWALVRAPRAASGHAASVGVVPAEMLAG